MRPLLPQAQRSLSAKASRWSPKHPSRSFSNAIKPISQASSVCLQCQYRASVVPVRPTRSPSWPAFASNLRRLHQPSDDGPSKPDNETPEERLARVRADIALRERQERERLEKERLEKEKKERERQEKERQEKARQEKERQERERVESERRERERHAVPRAKPLPDAIELHAPIPRSAPKTDTPLAPNASEDPSLNAKPTSTAESASNKDLPNNRPTRDAAKDNIERVAADQLPSHHQAQRWDLSKRFQDLMDDILPKLAVVTQKVNTYTGTDYSGIEALKREIKEQEKLVKTRRGAIDEAKQALDTALSKQASAQKEVVALLERKHSWSDTDLERYMSLIRSEHVNDQAVREAKDSIAQAENALEEARSRLEKRERAQYHEEQIWSDTIRRNSTWVTFGLMGLNIFLLLATMMVIEPWRRRRMVREIRAALEAQKPAVETPIVMPVATAETHKMAETEKPSEITNTRPAAANVVETSTAIREDPIVSSEPPAAIGQAPPLATTPSPEVTITSPTQPPQPVVTQETTILPESIAIEEDLRSDSTLAPKTWKEQLTYIATDIVSDRTISMRRIDYTAAVIQSAAAGAVITAAIVAMIVNK